jgi:predicted HicB family RNase H-like nuclease
MVILMRTKVPVPVYSERLNVVVPSPLHDAITTAAHSSMQSVNSFVRGAVLERLRREGFAPSPGKAA